MQDYSIIEINGSNISLLQKIADEQRLEGGSTFVQRTIDEWKSGVNTFSKSGEKLWGLTIAGELVGLGGLNQDHYLNDSSVGRVRHVYIAKKYRGRGLSKVLLNLIISEAGDHFKKLRLNTDNPVASSLYESFGFVRTTGFHVSHEMEF